MQAVIVRGQYPRHERLAREDANLAVEGGVVGDAALRVGQGNQCALGGEALVLHTIGVLDGAERAQYGAMVAPVLHVLVEMVATVKEVDEKDGIVVGRSHNSLGGNECEYCRVL